ncbi:MAG TPA: hypothetical protein VHQ01_01260, partial [Pyrinomonadaceae bacterium]|nr:hypothetical protein [Pyrinomonadaceae bacterium]
LREHCNVESIEIENGEVTGIRCHGQEGPAVIEKAQIVIGADGRNSIVARATDAQKYNEKPNYACWYYSYWSGVPVDGIEFYMMPDHAIGYLPTNDGMICMPVSSKHDEFDCWRADVEGSYLRALESVPKLAERISRGKREERIYGTGDVPNFFRKSHGPGWALVGDAGYHKDPVGAQGISDAFRDAENIADAVDKGLSGQMPMGEALAQYEEERNREVMAMYEFNSQMASLEPPPPEMQQLLGALSENRADTERFFGVISGTVPVPEFFAPENMQRIMAAGQTSH